METIGYNEILVLRRLVEESFLVETFAGSPSPRLRGDRDRLDEHELEIERRIYTYIAMRYLSSSLPIFLYRRRFMLTVLMHDIP
jgi:hypothetical protein